VYYWNLFAVSGCKQLSQAVETGIFLSLNLKKKIKFAKLAGSTVAKNLKSQVKRFARKVKSFRRRVISYHPPRRWDREVSTK
jgi:hypothetical protein